MLGTDRFSNMKKVNELIKIPQFLQFGRYYFSLSNLQ